MAALTTDTTLFKAIGSTDPEIVKSGIAIKRALNFAMSNATASTNYEFLPLPKGFVLKGVYVKELAKCSSGTITLKTKSDSATIGSAVTVGSTTLAESYLPAKSTDAKDSAGTGTVAVPANVNVLAGDMLCIVPNANMTAGEIEVVVHGFLVNGDTLNGYELSVPYRETQTDSQASGNVSGGDLYLKKVEKTA